MRSHPQRLPHGPRPQGVQRIERVAPSNAVLTERHESRVQQRIQEHRQHERYVNRTRPGPTDPPRQNACGQGQRKRRKPCGKPSRCPCRQPEIEYNEVEHHEGAPSKLAMYLGSTLITSAASLSRLLDAALDWVIPG